jgi:hypothetical protein
LSDGGGNITSYLIYRGEDPEHPALMDTVSGDTLTWTDGSVEVGRMYFYWVVAENSAGPSDMVRVVSITISDEDGSDWTLFVAASGALAALVSAGILVIRRSRQK